MGLAKSFSAQLVGLKSEVVNIEVDITKGLHSFSVVGLGDRAVEESKDRIAAAIKNSGFVSPKQKNQKIVISLAPADIRKEGPSFDLGMAMAYLLASEDIDFEPEGKMFLGELSLEGKLCKIHGILPILYQARSQGFTEAYISMDNSEESSLVEDITVYPARSLNEVIEHLTGKKSISPNPKKYISSDTKDEKDLDMSNIKGNEVAKRGLEIAAAGAHNIIMCGPPGTGKTMLAKSFSSILPNLSYEQAIEVTSIHSVAQNLNNGFIHKPPFRSPHHTASYPSIVGGGGFPKPGEITLAHRGVLFLDEFPEFHKSVIEALRQPLEDRVITISRARGVITFPAQCILIASMNPCPCGKGSGNGCACTMKSLQAYRHKISGPIFDRLDVWLNINKIDYAKLSSKESNAEKSITIRERVIKAREIQKRRFASNNINKIFNSEMSASDLENIIKMEESARFTLTKSAEKMELSGRSFHRIIKMSQTIADLAGSETITNEHILEALQYRQKIL